MSPIPIIVQVYLIILAVPLKRLDPGPQLDLPGPGAARLAVQREIGLGDRVRVEEPVRAAFVGARVAFLGDAAIDNDVAYMDILRLQFASEALREAAQGKFAHRERRRIWIALDRGAGPGEEDRAVALLRHAPRRLLGDEKPTERGDLDRLLDRRRIEVDDWSAGPAAGVVND